jgi:hypothetical protein
MLAGPARQPPHVERSSNTPNAIAQRLGAPGALTNREPRRQGIGAIA